MNIVKAENKQIMLIFNALFFTSKQTTKMQIAKNAKLIIACPDGKLYPVSLIIIKSNGLSLLTICFKIKFEIETRAKAPAEKIANRFFFVTKYNNNPPVKVNKANV